MELERDEHEEGEAERVNGGERERWEEVAEEERDERLWWLEL